MYNMYNTCYIHVLDLAKGTWIHDYTTMNILLETKNNTQGYMYLYMYHDWTITKNIIHVHVHEDLHVHVYAFHMNIIKIDCKGEMFIQKQSHKLVLVL